MITDLLPGDVVSERAYDEKCYAKIVIAKDRVMSSNGDHMRIGFYMRTQSEKSVSIGIPVRVWSEEE